MNEGSQTEDKYSMCLPSEQEQLLYSVLREQVTHENELYMKRLTTLLGTSLALFVGYGFVFQTFVVAGLVESLVALGVCVLIACLGMLTAKLIGNRMSDASTSIDRISERWVKRPIKAKIYGQSDSDEIEFFPKPEGNNMRKKAAASLSRKIGTGDLPKLIIFGWASILLLSVLAISLAT